MVSFGLCRANNEVVDGCVRTRVPAMEAIEEENESESDLMEYLVDALGYMLKMNRAGANPLLW